MRLVIADDEALLREASRACSPTRLRGRRRAAATRRAAAQVERRRPDVAIVDIRMPPTHTDEGLVAAQEIRERHPGHRRAACSPTTSTSRYAMRLLEEYPERAGYLLKDRVSDVAVLADALRRIGEGECVIDPTIVSRLLRAPREQRPARRADRARARGALADGRGPLQRRRSRPLFLSRARRSRATSARSSSSSGARVRPTPTAACSRCSLPARNAA